jgi:hypothetical protein
LFFIMPGKEEETSPLVHKLSKCYPEGDSKSWGTRLRKWAGTAEGVKARIDDFLSGEAKETLKSPCGWSLVNCQGLEPKCAIELLTSLARGECLPKRSFLGRVTPETAIPTVIAFVEFSGESWITKIQHYNLLKRGQRALGYLGNHVQTLNQWATFQPEGAQHLVVQVAPYITGECIGPPYPPAFVTDVAEAMITSFHNTFNEVSRTGEVPLDLFVAGNVLWQSQEERCIVIDADVEALKGKIGQNTITGKAAETIYSHTCKLGGGENLPFSYMAGGKKLTFNPNIFQP